MGDKAILASIIEYYSIKYKNIEIAVSSLYPFVTQKTLLELGFQKRVKIIYVYSLAFLHYCQVSDEVIMGGGPLMGIDTLGIPLVAFQLAKLYHHKRTIFGCGIGPLKQKKHIKYVKKILLLSTKIAVRDSASAKWIQNHIHKKLAIQIVSDPSIAYLKKHYTKNPSKPQKILACFLREWTERVCRSNVVEKSLKRKKLFLSLKLPMPLKSSLTNKE